MRLRNEYGNDKSYNADAPPGEIQAEEKTKKNDQDCGCDEFHV